MKDKKIGQSDHS